MLSAYPALDEQLVNVHSSTESEPLTVKEIAPPFAREVQLSNVHSEKVEENDGVCRSAIKGSFSQKGSTSVKGQALDEKC